ncbi:MAG: methionine synthase [Dehalococcoidia bacterium]|nr:MAG: methionine synthase [Dehalococcoidia bacterium]
MPDTDFNCLPTVIGSLPHRDANAACALVGRYLKDIPAWPQLPRRSPKEDMNAQYSEGFPGIALEDGNLRVRRQANFEKELERLYTAYLAGDFSKYHVSDEYAAGLYCFLETKFSSARAVKGQVTGPVTWGLVVADETRRAIIYDEVLGEALPKFLRLKVAWMENKLREVNPRTIMFIDEPYLASFGSVAVPLSREKVTSLLDEVLGGIRGLKGIHCCGNTDWPVVLATSIDILNFDAYNFANSLALYTKDVKRFIDRGGAIAWGIVPSSDADLARETVASLKDRLEEAMAPFARNGIHIRQLREQALLTPSCGLAGLSEEAAEDALVKLTGLSKTLQEIYR